MEDLSALVKCMSELMGLKARVIDDRATGETYVTVAGEEIARGFLEDVLREKTLLWARNDVMKRAPKLGDPFREKSMLKALKSPESFLNPNTEKKGQKRSETSRRCKGSKKNSSAKLRKKNRTAVKAATTNDKKNNVVRFDRKGRR